MLLQFSVKQFDTGSSIASLFAAKWWILGLFSHPLVHKWVLNKDLQLYWKWDTFLWNIQTHSGSIRQIRNTSQTHFLLSSLTKWPWNIKSNGSGKKHAERNVHRYHSNTFRVTVYKGTNTDISNCFSFFFFFFIFTRAHSEKTMPRV